MKCNSPQHRPSEWYCWLQPWTCPELDDAGWQIYPRKTLRSTMRAISVAARWLFRFLWMPFFSDAGALRHLLNCLNTRPRQLRMINCRPCRTIQKYLPEWIPSKVFYLASHSWPNRLPAGGSQTLVVYFANRLIVPRFSKGWFKYNVLRFFGVSSPLSPISHDFYNTQYMYWNTFVDHLSPKWWTPFFIIP